MSRMVYGLHFVGVESTEHYVHWCWVTKAITEILSDSVQDLEIQKEVIRNLYKRKVVATLKRNEKEWPKLQDSFLDTNSRCDVINFQVDDRNGQIGEILEHILHFIHIGERYTFPEWSIESPESTKAWEAVKEAENAGVYDTADYKNIDDKEARNRIILQEFHFLLVFASWNIVNDGEFNLGPEGEWQGVNNLKEMKKKLPKTFKLFKKTTGKVLGKPSLDTMRSLGTLMAGGTPDTCNMPM
eukprot:CAMPEP_0113326842 /NCGR_PEP_ID=MMETSP0010_2-20120614/18829_1 /TAXON_ID=216773 ORGANISM="Corethron hystrix, Strain 308" /NCGR_SAMPLE_ID=MMETSP0010_2 /ASSEMBLY_ACC=CAM_ASM_000155 /LENGTH=241 /DNA_ID=CAMNT_0000187385 /DNA_START=1007 /DNA_END=1732 /DNA_ORIENTATION=- /assembly_acc=CAM_ASM_000155